nr:glycosyl hydrolase [Thermoanaerobaculia bacterium]
DLTRNDKEKQKWSGGPITGDNTGVEIYCTIFSIALSPAEKGVIWVGSDDGLVHVSRDAGASWQKVTPPGFPEWATVEGIEASRFTAGTAYVAVDAHRLDDPRPYVFKTTDYGKTWVKITDGLAADSHIYVVREDSRDPQLLFAGSGRGISFSRNGGKSWEPLKLNLPTLAVTDLVVKGDDLVVGTTGRSLWILDDFSPLRRAPAELEAKKLDLLAARPAYRFSYDGSNTDEGLGANPPRGAILYYHLKDKVEGEATLEITDSKGRLVRKLSSVAEVPEYAEDDPDDPTDKPEADLSIEAGLHRAVWDLHYEGADRLDKAKVDNGNPRRGPFAPPGVYRLKLSAGGETAEGELQVLPDPRGKATSEALAAQLDMALSVREGINRTTHAIRQVRAIREQTSDLARRLAGRADATELATLAAKVAEKATALEEKLHNPKAQVTYDILAFQGGTKLYSNLAFVFDTVEDGDGAPTQGAQEVYTSLLAELLRYEHELQELRATDLARLDQLATGLSLPRVLVP